MQSFIKILMNQNVQVEIYGTDICIQSNKIKINTFIKINIFATKYFYYTCISNLN